jgi:hypothetical protein
MGHTIVADRLLLPLLYINLLRAALTYGLGQRLGFDQKNHCIYTDSAILNNRYS